jgi:cytochrome c oxidase accessory protein FixG
MEMVFRKIEYWIEGDSNAQRRLNKAPWGSNKIVKKGSKHLIFIILSMLISHTALAYIIGVEEVKAVVSDSPTEHLGGFIGIVAFTGIFYWVFAWFREQACTVVCPYGRLQGVLLGKDSIVVAYDWIRGEPRGKLHRGQVDALKGDCIDCKLCLHVCPTGIDIRNGTQLECVNCTACIDACDEVMLKIHKPKGLIRFASFNSIQEGIKKLLSGRVVGYSIVLIALVGLLGFMVFTRSDIETTILKVPGTLYQKGEDGLISNLYNIEFVNKTFEDKVLDVRLESPSQAVLIRVGAQQVVVPAGEMTKGVYFVKIPVERITSTKTLITIAVYSGGEKLETVKAKFIGPVKHESD